MKVAEPTAGHITIQGATTASGNVYAAANNALSGSNNFSGNTTFVLPPLASGEALTNLNATNVSGTISSAIGAIYATNLADNATALGDLTVSGGVYPLGYTNLFLYSDSTGKLVGTNNGVALTNLNADNIASGTVADARIVSTIARDSETLDATNSFYTQLKAANTGFTGSNNFAGNTTFALPPLGSGNALTNMLQNNIRQATNTWGNDVVNFALGRSVSTNMAGNLTIAGIVNFVDSDDNWQVIDLNPNGADRTLVVPAEWYVTGFTNATTCTITNGTWAELCVTAIIGRRTNAVLNTYY